ncbi:hypothetical protein L208DRAFT_1414470, partial [Tricholoma matsutake]
VVTTAEEVAASVNLEEGWLDKLLELPTDELAKLLGDIANHGKVKTAVIKKARTSLPSFSGVKRSDFAERFGLPDSLENNRFERVVTPVYRLPPSIHEIMFEAGWRTQDVYQERQAQRREVARVRIMDPYLVRIIGLFQGRVIDKPEQDMLETEYASGGEVSMSLTTVLPHIFMIGGTLFFIAKFKLDISLEDNVAQLFVKILATAKANEKVDFANLCIYGLLTDLIDFHFYSYNPPAKEFAFDKTLVVNITRDMVFTDMIPVSNKIFNMILTAYINGLEATMLKSIGRKEKGDVSSPGSMPLQRMRAWKAPSEQGLTQQCRDKFEEPVETIDDIERNSTAALELLAKSVWFIPHVLHLMGAANPSSTEEIKDLAHRMVHTKYLNMMNNNKLFDHSS